MDSRVYDRSELPFIGLAYRDDHDAAVTISRGKLIRVIGAAEDAE